MIRVAVLDDSSADLMLFKKQVEDEEMHVDTYKNCDDFLSNFNHDFAVIDINLGNRSRNGFDIMEELAKKHKVPVVMISHDIKPSEKAEAFLSKSLISNKEVKSRFTALKAAKQMYNLLQINFGRGDFESRKFAI